MPAQSVSRHRYGLSKIVPLSYERAIEKVKEELKRQGFGVLAEIDVRKTMKEKLNAEYPNYVILGACNPQLAYRALQAEPQLGLLLPCNVTVRDTADGTEVAVVDAGAMLAVVGNEALQPVAREAAERLQRVIESM
jgi:uncharacterized protein (DUF302 family)